MPRSARVVVPGYPHHVIQRGHNKQDIFLESEDYEYYLSSLMHWRVQLNVELYAYCLMTNHVHLLLAPSSANGLGQLMKRVAGRQTRFFNTKYQRCGTLWEGRFKSSIVDSSNYLANCARYIELNPVRAGLVVKPEDYIWSSYREHIRLTPQLHVCDPFESLPDAEGYSAYVSEGISSDELEFIQSTVERNQLTGTPEFIDEIEALSSVRIEHRGRGRPRKNGK